MGSGKSVGVGVGMMFIKDGKVLLGKRNDNPEIASSELHGEETWTMPGGKLRFGEKIEDAACREVMDECGIKVEKEKLKRISVSEDIVDNAHFVTFGFLCGDFEGEAKVMEDEITEWEITEWEWSPLNELPKPIFFPSEKILKKYFELNRSF